VPQRLPASISAAALSINSESAEYCIHPRHGALHHFLFIMSKTSPPSSIFTDSKKIIVAAKAGDIESVMALCGRMPSRSQLLNTRTTVKGETPLIKAVQYGHRELARWLMMVGADPYITDSGGKGAFQVGSPSAPSDAFYFHCITILCHNFFFHTFWQWALEKGDHGITETLQQCLFLRVSNFLPPVSLFENSLQKRDLLHRMIAGNAPDYLSAGGSAAQSYGDAVDAMRLQGDVTFGFFSDGKAAAVEATLLLCPSGCIAIFPGSLPEQVMNDPAAACASALAQWGNALPLARFYVDEIPQPSYLKSSSKVIDSQTIVFDLPPSTVAFRCRSDGPELLRSCQSILRELARRKAALRQQLQLLGSQKATAFDNQQHGAVMDELWNLVFPSPEALHQAVSRSVEPSLKTSVPDWAGKHRNWCLMGFQRPDLPQSDLRGCGVLTLHVLLYFVKEHRDLIFSLLCCQSMRKDGYPFAASVINIIQLLIKELQPDSGGADSLMFLYLARFSDVEHSFDKLVLELSVLVERIWTVCRPHTASDNLPFP
jgi:hypothetical protein